MNAVEQTGQSHAPVKIETPVLIVGAGPAGQLAALLLSHQGIASTIVERRVERSTAPKAHAVNPRTLEICASVGLAMDEFYRLAAPASQGGLVQFMSSLSGVALGALPYERQDDAVRALTPYPLANIAQPRFEQLLSQAIDQRNDISVLRGCTCTDVAQDADGVSVQVELKSAASPVIVRSQYLLAADGANSRIRDRLGITMEGPEAIEHYMMIHFRADLSELVAANPGILYFLCHPDISAMMIAYDHADNWVLMQRCDPAEHTRDNFDVDTCIDLIRKAVGKPVGHITICNVSPWVMSSQVANEYRRGRIFLVGDAAHRFPPTGGLGLNTGVGDVQNLCWKIAAIENGWAEPALLDSYEAERKAVAEVNSTQSLHNAVKMFDLFAYLYGDNTDQQKLHFEKICSEALTSPELKAAIEVQRPHFDSLGLQLGYSYADEAWRSEPGIDISDYRPSYSPGSHLPHFWLKGEGDSAVSILEQLPVNQFSLLVTAGQQGWRALLNSIDIPVLCLCEGADFVGLHEAWGEQAALADTGALLIRPDGHIAAVFERPMGDAKQRLCAALAAQLCNPLLKAEKVA
ncbi:2,4-dichlorophenol 6-monooxygenase [Halioglobus japonicus]|nr:2,4-dichlorophenol 6-monooxygenase [Halioglobus japonicus]